MRPAGLPPVTRLGTARRLGQADHRSPQFHLHEVYRVIITVILMTVIITPINHTLR